MKYSLKMAGDNLQEGARPRTTVFVLDHSGALGSQGQGYLHSPSLLCAYRNLVLKIVRERLQLAKRSKVAMSGLPHTAGSCSFACWQKIQAQEVPWLGLGRI